MALTADSFCPECGNDLNEATSPGEESGEYYVIEPPPHRAFVMRAFDLWHGLHAIGLGAIAIMVLMIVCIEAINRNTWATALVVSIALLVLGEWIRRYRYWSNLIRQDDPDFDEPDGENSE